MEEGRRQKEEETRTGGPTVRMVLHQFMKDLRLLKWHVATWLLVVSAANVTVLGVAATWFPSRELLDRTNSLAMFLDMAAAAALVMIADNSGEVLSAKVTTRGYEVSLCQTGPHRFPTLSYLLRNPRGEVLNPGGITRLSEPFFTTTVPVPQYLSVVATTVVFPWTGRPDTDLETWVKGAVVAVTERQ
jgi:hypothetical protein